MMACADVRAHLLAYQAGRLPPTVHDTVRTHLEGCSACAHEDAAEHALTEILERRLPQHPAPLALKRRLASRWPAAPNTPMRRWRRPLALAAAGSVLALLVATLVAVAPWWGRAAPDIAAISAEAVNDHLRVVQRRDALPIASPLIHQVKPWFTARIDFAPIVPFAGDAEFPLRGGDVERFLDRQAAVLVYGRRLHTISLLVFRADGLAWPIDASRQRAASVRGFNVVVWRAGDLGYALVSDVDGRDLAELARRLGAA
jgi:anti-sigma factor (TIGR02949 family)